MTRAIDIEVGDVTDVEAHVLARYRHNGGENVRLRGTVRGPFCEGVRTLTAEFEFRAVKSDEAGVVMAEALITDPCMWSARMPHLYDVDVEARQGERVAVEYHRKIGLRRLAPRRPVDFAPGTG